MTFEKWLKQAKLECVTANSYTQGDLKAAWNAAISQAQRVVGEHASANALIKDIGKWKGK